jgi:hypothetical protein
MRIRSLLLVAILTAGAQHVAVAQQTLGDVQFHVRYSASGITSVTHVHDKYDTEYISAGETLGDILIRFRAHGEKTWNQASAATLDKSSGTDQPTASFTIGVQIPTIATSSKASASVRFPGVFALNDQRVPKSSHDTETPLFVWPRRKGTREWVQYDFPAPKKVWSAEVYWAQDDNSDHQWKLPKSWRVLYHDGDSWKEVNAKRNYSLLVDQDSKAFFEPVTTSALRVEAQLDDNATAGIFEWRVNDEGKQVRAITDLRANEKFQLQNHGLLWTISLNNNTDHEMEVGDLALPLPFNTQYVWDKTETYTKRLIAHRLIAGNGSFIYWMRTNAEGPYLVMTPLPDTALEYFEASRFPRSYAAYVHSAASGEELRAKGGTWRLPNTRLLLAPKGHAGDSKTYGFRFRWAQDYAGVRDVLYEENLFDVNVVPGMTVPSDLAAMLSLRTHNPIRAIVPEYPDKTKIEYVGERGKDVHLYKVRFSRLGENLLKVDYGNGCYLSLEFFVTEPLETLYKKRAAFLVSHEQHKDPSKWYKSLFSQWDMKHQILRSPDDLDGLQSYAVASDDTALGKAPYVAGKNIFFPVQTEIDAVENYLKNFVWGGLQETEKEPYPYAIYGIPNWKANRDSPKDDQSGKKHVWRIYDYPHVILLYFNMYELAKLYPKMTAYLDKDGYLERAFGTAKAFFTVPLEILKWSTYETGTYNELVIPDLIQALEENGHKDQADWLRAAWEKKVKYFVNDHPYLFGSEYPFDSTGFESTHAFAKYALSHVLKPGEAAPPDLPPDDFRRAVKYEDADALLNQQIKLNLACRGWLETSYYHLGSDFRASGSASYTLSYMAQMGGWAISDYALYFAQDPATYMRLAYASYLSSWALLNSGTPESNYGYWYPGKENDGGASGGFEPRPWGRAWLGDKEMGRGPWWYSGEIDLGFDGALRAAATVVVDDPIFGLFAYGGEVEQKNALTYVIPKDGVRARFHVVRGSQRLHLLLERDGFAAGQPISFDDALHRITLSLENRGGDRHDTIVHIAGLALGTYQVAVQDRPLQTLTSHDGEDQQVLVVMESNGASITITREKSSTSATLLRASPDRAFAEDSTSKSGFQER